MANTNGLALPASGLKSLQVKDRATLRELLLLAALGAAAVLIHAATRGRLDLAPGYQGVWWVAALIAGRKLSRFRWAGMAVAAGAAGTSMLPVWGFGDPLRWLTYFLAALVVDALFLILISHQIPVWLFAVMGGLAHMTKPLMRVVIGAATGTFYDSLMWGVAYPSATHFVFGFVGALIGAGVFVAIRKRWQE